MSFSSADVLLWSRCHRQWVHQCLPVGDNGVHQRKPALPVEINGEANLRESARVIADSIARRTGTGSTSTVDPYAETYGAYLSSEDVPAVAMLPVLVLAEEQLSAWAEATQRAITAQNDFIHGVLVAGEVAVLVDRGVYHGKVEAWEFEIYRPATGVRGIYHTECALAARAADLLGIPLGGLHLYYLSKSARLGDLSETTSFYLESNLLKRARKMRQEVDGEIDSLVDVVAAGGRVGDDYWCSARCNLCAPRETRSSNRYDPLTLHKGGAVAREFVRAGIIDLRDETLPLEKLSKKQRIQIEAVRSGEIYIDTVRLNRFLDRLEPPLFFLDFEAFAPSLPPFHGLAPYEHTPALVSIHTLDTPDGVPQARSFASTPGGDERVELYRWILETVGTTGSIVVFSRSFEAAMIRQLGEIAEDRAGARDIEKRMVDLLEPFSEFHVYHPEQRGKVSLKRVLPVFTDRVGYRATKVKDGMHANLGYIRLHDGAMIRAARDGATPERLAPGISGAIAAEGASGTMATYCPETVTYVPSVAEITEYCAVDTIAMHYLIEQLRAIAATERSSDADQTKS